MSPRLIKRSELYLRQVDEMKHRARLLRAFDIARGVRLSILTEHTAELAHFSVDVESRPAVSAPLLSPARPAVSEGALGAIRREKQLYWEAERFVSRRQPSPTK